MSAVTLDDDFAMALLAFNFSICRYFVIFNGAKSELILAESSRAPLVCTVGNKANSTLMFPADRLCEYIFYDSLYKRGPKEFEPHDLDADFRLFIDEHRRFVATEFGVGISFWNVFTPQLFIALGHYECGDNTFQDCRVVPPTLLSRPPQLSADNSSYQHDMTMAADSVRKMAARGVNALWAISVTMKGRWTVLEKAEKPDVLSRCVYDPEAVSFGSYPELCTIKAQHTSTDIGIAVYDVDYEDFANTCARTNWGGRFSRLRALQLLLNFFRTKFNDPSEEDACLRLIT
ncbi:hypothetical protein HPB50_014216 [Hyalomma asiaticum]|uniref:Uncharacterized protein n=1 Tax=Hyalomma asiaticum TaxID=266040 RepID=A0ACB7TA74_HYAAI|nr:hypothetical protein HPB50_014216 [Hyalomma asiaticum]